jgi:hypothetical protein
VTTAAVLQQSCGAKERIIRWCQSVVPRTIPTAAALQLTVALIVTAKLLPAARINGLWDCSQVAAAESRQQQNRMHVLQQHVQHYQQQHQKSQRLLASAVTSSHCTASLSVVVKTLHNDESRTMTGHLPANTRTGGAMITSAATASS